MDSLDNNQTVIAEQPKEPGFFSRLANIFVSPSAAMESINRQPTWFWALVLIALVSLVVAMVVMPFALQMQIEMIRNNPNIPPEQARMIEQQMSQGGAIQYIGAIFGIIIGIPLMSVIIAAIFYFAGSVLLGGDSTFKKNFSIWIWAGSITALGAIIKLPVMYIKKSAMVTFSPALFLSGDNVGKPIYTLFSNFDFFVIWQLAVFAIGYSIIYKFSKAKSFLTVGVLWVIWIIIHVTFASIFSRFGIM